MGPIAFSVIFLMAAIIGCGSGIVKSAPDALQVSPNVINFGSVNIGKTGKTSVAISNAGLDAVSISQLSVSDQTFSVSDSDTLPINIPPSSTYTFAVGFTPVASINYSGKVTMLDATSKPIAQLQMQGTGSNTGISNTGISNTGILIVSARNLAFGNVPVNTSATQSLTLTSSGTSPVTITSATITGTGFAIVAQSFPVTLNPGQSLTLQGQFSPTMTGTAIGQLVINSDSSTGSSALVVLSGTGTVAATPQLTVSVAALNFGNLSVNTSATQSLTLKSTGTSPVTVNSATITGAEFSIAAQNLPVTLSPNQSVTLQLKFTPAVTGTAIGQLTISSDSSTGSSAAVALSGTGTATVHEVDLSWNSPTDSPDPVMGYNVYRAIGSGPFAVINPSPALAVTYVDTTVVSGTSYTYEITSVDSIGNESVPSNQVTVTIP